MTHMSGGFRIDPERAPEAIRDLEWALHELEDIRRTALSMGTVDPGSHDSVSIEAAHLIGQAAVGGPNSLVAALDVGTAQIRELITAMRADLSTYGETETASRGRFDAERA